MHILIVDDEKMQREMLQGFLLKQGHEVMVAASGEEALKVVTKDPVQLVITDHKMEGMSGAELICKLHELSPLIRTIMVTAYGTVSRAVEVMQSGADDFLEKPVDLEALLSKILQIEKSTQDTMDATIVVETIDQEELPLSLIGSSRPMQELLSLVKRVSQTEWTALIHGETGTGKELIARLIHLLSPRKEGPFIELNCAAVPENLFESELFGHEKGAFTGAVARRKGRFELASGGTIFLDEVGELPTAVQAKLLRALQEKRITRVGGETEIDIDVRVLAATNRDLQIMVEQRSFREDLYFRLNVLELPLPPLRRRRDDIVELTTFFMDKHGGTRLEISQEAMAQLVKYDFPGNVRELEHLVQRLVTFTRGNRVTIQDLPKRVQEYSVGSGRLEERLAEIEKQMITQALSDHNGVQTKAAESLGISERVLRYKIKKAGLK